MKRLAQFCLLILFLLTLFLFDTESAYAITLDDVFGSSGKTVMTFGKEASATDVIQQSDEKYISVGNIINNSNNRDWAISRYNNDGGVDASFANNGIYINDFGGQEGSHGDFVNGVVLQQNGKIIVGGSSAINSSTVRWTIARFNTNGSLDNTFGSTGIVVTTLRSGFTVEYINDLIVQPDGKILGIGVTHIGSTDVGLVRYNSDGSLDTSFDGDGIVTTQIGSSNDRGNAAALQENGKIVVLGDFDAGGHDEIFLVRYNIDGSLDTGFGIGGKVITQFGSNAGARDVVIQSDKKIVITGGAVVGGFGDVFVARYNPDGVLDSTFGVGGKVINSFSSGTDYANSIMLNPDGKIIVAGALDVQGPASEDFMLARFNPDGSIDTTFGTGGLFTTPIGAGRDIITSAILQPDGKIVVVGNTQNGSYNDWVIARFSDEELGVNLEVPYYSQNSNPWGATEYDHANTLPGFTNPTTMDRWGCVVTSAAMVLNYHGMTNFGDGSLIDPGSLNNWLKNNNGYQTGRNKNGEPFSKFIWSSVPRLTRELFSSGNATYKLMHKRSGNVDKEDVLTDDLINNSSPGILGVSNLDTDAHFVVGEGINEDGVFTINDPEWNYPDLQSFDNTFFQLERYVKSNTNFSYIELSVNEEVEILVIDSSDNKTGRVVKDGVTEVHDQIPNAIYAHQNSISNPDNNDNKENLGIGFNEFLLPEPNGEQYQIILSSEENETYTFNIATVQSSGEDQNLQFTGALGEGAQDKFNIQYSQNSDSTFEEIVSFDSLIDDINYFRDSGDIKSFGVYISLLAKANVDKGLGYINTKASKNVLKALQNNLRAQKGKKINEEAYSVISDDIQVLTSSL